MIKHRKECRGCFSEDVVDFLDLGNVPLAGGFISKDEIKNEKLFPLKVYFCKECGLVQVLDVVDPDVLFKNYFYTSSVIKSLSKHFEEYAKFLKTTYLKKPNVKLLEFGCNDGVLLQHLKKVEAYGIDPSDNVSALAKEKDLNVWTDFFNQETSKKIIDKIGKVDVVTGSNVFAHIDNIHEVIKAAKIALKPNGVFIVEVHYLKDLIDKFQYDTIYHEHLCYYSVTALKKIFAINDMRIIDVIHLDMHGGGIRAVVTNNDSELQENKSVNIFLNDEKNISLDELKKFGKHCIEHKKQLTDLLSKIKERGQSIVGYGAPGRGTILLNYCNIGNDFLDYIVDVSPLRAGKLMPGVHVPIYKPEKSRNTPPDFFLLLAWNYQDSILEQEKKLIEKGVRFINPFPSVNVL